MADLEIDREALERVCRKHHIRRLALFGSALRDDFGPESDVDVLVEFESEHVPGLAFFEIEDQLSKVFDRKVDLNTPQFLSRNYRERVLRQARVQYDAA